jgi:hypothetical protein
MLLDRDPSWRTRSSATEIPNMETSRSVTWTATVAAFVCLAYLASSVAVRADDRKIIWRLVTTWSVISGPPDMPPRYERGNGDFATQPECQKALDSSRDRFEASRAETEQNARKAGARNAQFLMTSECAPRYADTSSAPL